MSGIAHLLSALKHDGQWGSDEPSVFDVPDRSSSPPPSDWTQRSSDMDHSDSEAPASPSPSSRKRKVLGDLIDAGDNTGPRESPKRVKASATGSLTRPGAKSKPLERLSIPSSSSSRPMIPTPPCTPAISSPDFSSSAAPTVPPRLSTQHPLPPNPSLRPTAGSKTDPIVIPTMRAPIDPSTHAALTRRLARSEARERLVSEEVAKLTAALAKANGENKRLASSAPRLDDSFTKRLTDEVSALKRAFEATDSENKRLSKTLAGTEGKKKMLVKELSALSLALESKSTKHLEEIKGLRARILFLEQTRQEPASVPDTATRLLEETVASLASDVSRLEEEKSRLSQQTASLKGQFSLLEEKARGGNAEVLRLKETLAASEKARDGMTGRLQKLESQLLTVVDRETTLEGRVSALKAKVKALEAEKEELVNDHEVTLQDTIQSFESQMQEVTVSLKKDSQELGWARLKMTSLKEENEKLLEHQTLLQATISSLETQDSGRRADVSNLTAALAASDKARIELVRLKRAAEAKEAGALEQIQTLTHDLTRTREDLSTHQASAKAIDMRFMEEKNLLESALAASRAENAELKERIRVLDKTVEEMKTSNQQWLEEAKRLKSALSGSQTDATRLQERYLSLESQVGVVEAETLKWAKKATDLATTLSAAIAEKNTLVDRVKTLEAMRSDLDNAAPNREKEVEGLTEQLCVARSICEEFNVRCASLSAENRALKEKVRAQANIHIRIGELEANKTEYLEKITSLTSEVTKAKIDSKAAWRVQSAMENDVKKKGETIKSMLAQLSSMTEVMNELKGRCVGLTSKKEKLEKEVAAVSALLDTARSDLANHRCPSPPEIPGSNAMARELASLQAILSNTVASRDRLLQHVGVLEARDKHFLGELSRLSDSLNESQRDRSALENNMRTLSERYALTQQEKHALMQQVEALRDVRSMQTNGQPSTSSLPHTPGPQTRVLLEEIDKRLRASDEKITMQVRAIKEDAKELSRTNEQQLGRILEAVILHSRRIASGSRGFVEASGDLD